MVYIYKKTIGNKHYYYLRASERKGEKVFVKDIAYLGGSVGELQNKLENLSKYSERIRKTHKTINRFLESNRYLEKAMTLKLKHDPFLKEKLVEVEACKIHFNKVFQKNPSLTKQEIIINFIIEFAFNTSSIEGNTINLAETRNLLQEGKTPKGKTIREVYELQNAEKILFELIEDDKELSHELIQHIHECLMRNIGPRIGYRTSDVRVLHSNFEATPAPYVKTDMNLLLQWYEKNKTILHPLVLAVVFHHKFEKIHPLMEGNGRTGRMLLNVILIKHKYPPIIIHTSARQKYLQVLRKADTIKLLEINSSYQELISFTAEEMIKTYWNIFL